MLTIVHGSDQLSSRNYFLEQKDKESITFDAQNLNIVELEQSLGGNSLFGTSKKIFIDNLFNKKGLKNVEIVVELLKKSQDAHVYIWADKEIGAKSLSGFPKFQNQNFKIPQNIWAFLDGIRPDNPKNVILFHQTLAATEVEVVFAMIIRQFRLMLCLVEGSDSAIDEVKRLAPWQRSKLTRQAMLFGIDMLKAIYKKLYKIEKSVKTGKSNLTLTQSIDILLLEI